MSDPSFNPPPERPTLSLFWSSEAAPGLQGLRAGWRLALFIALLIVGTLLIGRLHFLLAPLLPAALRQPVDAAHRLHPLAALLGEGLQFFLVALATWLMARFERRSFGTFGLPPRSARGRRNFALGMVWGVAALTLLLVAMRLCGVFAFGPAHFYGLVLLKFAVVWAAVFLLVGLFEESLFRGYAQITLGSGIGFWPAAILLSLVFGGIHIQNPGEDWVGALSAALIGLFFAFTLLRTGSLWFAVGFHAAWDWAESFLFGVPDSGLTSYGAWRNPAFHGSRWLTGGSVGPEGSLLVLLLIALLFFCFHVSWRPTHPSRPDSDGPQPLAPDTSPA